VSARSTAIFNATTTMNTKDLIRLGVPVGEPIQLAYEFIQNFITPDGRHAVSASRDNTLRVWDLESGKELALLTADSPTISCAVSLDGRTIVAGDVIGKMHILKNGRLFLSDGSYQGY
jgi:WD40 repeat protein